MATRQAADALRKEGKCVTKVIHYDREQWFIDKGKVPLCKRLYVDDFFKCIIFVASYARTRFQTMREYSREYRKRQLSDMMWNTPGVTARGIHHTVFLNRDEDLHQSSITHYVEVLIMQRLLSVTNLFPRQNTGITREHTWKVSKCIFHVTFIYFLKDHHC